MAERMTLEGLRSPVHLVKCSHLPLRGGETTADGKEGTWHLGLKERNLCAWYQIERSRSCRAWGPRFSVLASQSEDWVLFSHLPSTGRISVEPLFPAFFRWNVKDHSGHKSVGSAKLGKCCNTQDQWVLMRRL